jgi:hypothetical protein
MTQILISIQNNTFEAEQRPTTQEDNFGEIVERWDLFVTWPGKEKDGIKSRESVGHLVKYFSGSFAIFHHGFIRYDFSKNQVFINDQRNTKNTGERPYHEPGTYCNSID